MALSDRPRSSAPWGLVGALVLALAAESWVARHALDLTPAGALGFRFAGDASRESRRYDLICLGDSLVKHGVAPRVLKARLGRRALNLGCVGGTAPLSYFLLKRCLDAGARPSALLVDFKATQLQSTPRDVERAMAEVLGPSESVDLAWTARDPSMLGRLAVSGLLPSVRARPEIRAWVVAALTGGAASPRAENLAALRNWTANLGAGLLDRRADAEAVAEHWDERFISGSGPWYSHPLNALYLRRFLELAASRDVPVYWLLPPIHPRVQARRQVLGLDAGFDRMLRRASERYPNLTVIDGRRAGYPARHFVDSTHLDLDGAYAFTDDLASLMDRPPGRRPDLPRWVSLSAYHDRPRSAVFLEDQTGSRVALSAGPDSTVPRPAADPTARAAAAPLRR